MPYTERGEAFVAGEPRLWSAAPARPGTIALFDIVADASRALVVMPSSGEGAAPQVQPPVTFLLNFADELRRRVPTR